MDSPFSEAWLGDCMEYMARFPDGFFDLAVVDPPYFSGPETRGFYGKKDGGLTKRKDYRTIKSWRVPGPEYFNELTRVSKSQIVWGCNYFNWAFSPGRIVWDKCNDASSFSDCEIAACSIHSSVRIFRYMWSGAMQGESAVNGRKHQGNKKLNEKRIHPTQKPVALYAWLLNKYAKPGDKILDTHLGSQSSRIAAYKLGFDFWGCELAPDYYREGCDRFKRETAMPLFDKTHNNAESN